MLSKVIANGSQDNDAGIEYTIERSEAKPRIGANAMVDKAAQSMGRKSAAKRLAGLTAEQVSAKMTKLAKRRKTKLTKKRRSEIARLGGLARHRKAKKPNDLGES